MKFSLPQLLLFNSLTLAISAVPMVIRRAVDVRSVDVIARISGPSNLDTHIQPVLNARGKKLDKAKEKLDNLQQQAKDHWKEKVVKTVGIQIGKQVATTVASMAALVVGWAAKLITTVIEVVGRIKKVLKEVKDVCRTHCVFCWIIKVRL